MTTPLRQKQTAIRSERWDRYQNPANRSGVFSCVQKKGTLAHVSKQGASNFAAAAKRFKRYALLVRIR